MKVKNLSGSSVNNPKPTCNCVNWLEHWENNRVWRDGKKHKVRQCSGCKNFFSHEQLNGAHVIKVDSTDRSHYIIPLCDSCHGMIDKEYNVNKDDLVSANCSQCINKKVITF